MIVVSGIRETCHGIPAFIGCHKVELGQFQPLWGKKSHVMSQENSESPFLSLLCIEKESYFVIIVTKEGRCPVEVVDHIKDIIVQLVFLLLSSLLTFVSGVVHMHSNSK